MRELGKGSMVLAYCDDFTNINIYYSLKSLSLLCMLTSTSCYMLVLCIEGCRGVVFTPNAGGAALHTPLLKLTHVTDR